MVSVNFNEFTIGIVRAEKRKNNFCLLELIGSPFAVNKYHISYKQVSKTAGNNDHLLDRISEEVDLALHQYPGTWVPTNALIITWKVEVKADATKVFNGTLSVYLQFAILQQ